MERYICIHGHFYQPPRENAWLEEIEQQEGAEPFHDWNEKINSECYNPNAVARILNAQNEIIDIVNNYGKISFNFGPTLLSWQKKYAPATYQAIIEGDQESQRNFGGHGSAMAQVYNHIIMPLANKKDKETQVIWGIRDFESHYGRKPEGMWLAEAAVDIETLEILASFDIKFTVLAPNQAKRFRRIGTDEWYNGVETRCAYICNLPSGRKINLFFYDGEVSQAVAFKGLLNDGKRFANEIINRFYGHSNFPQLVHLATDGESYGHHHKLGEMALAYCLRYIEENNLAKITNYSQYLELCPPQFEVEIYENSSWSCAHGVERWRSNCGCSTGGEPGWTQRWRKPLREALDFLRDELIKIYEKEMRKYHLNPWGLRNEYIDVILDRQTHNVDKFLRKHFPTIEIDNETKTNILRLLEMQRQALLMYTSCAWFFNEISGIETVQVLQYANRALQLGERVSGKNIEKKFLEILEKAESNKLSEKNGAEIYKKYTIPARLSLSKVGMHYAVASLFAEDVEQIDVLNYHAENEYFERLEAGIQIMAMGRTTICSNITFSRKPFSFIVIYLGQHQIIGSASEDISNVDFMTMVEKAQKSFKESNLAEVLKVIQTYFPTNTFSILELFKDEKIKVLNQILEKNVQQARNTYSQIYERDYNILNLMRTRHLPVPKLLKRNLEIVINAEIEQFFEEKSLDTQRLKNLADEVTLWNVPLNTEQIALLASKRLKELTHFYFLDTSQTRLLLRISEILTSLKKIKIQPSISEMQNILFRTSKIVLPDWNIEIKTNPKLEIDKRIFLDLCRQVNLVVE
jgi:alpha-amylase/alpha-mannosidase (GH57 family)